MSEPVAVVAVPPNEIPAEVVTAAKRVSPNGNEIAIRTIFEDDTPGAVKSWLCVTVNGLALYLSEAEVATWRDLS